MNKHLSTAAAAVAFVSALGLAYAQTSDQPADTSTTATAQQSDATNAVNQGTTATPDWRSPDNMSAQQSTDATPAPADQPATTAPADTSNSAATTTDNGMSSTAPADTSAAPSAPAPTTDSSTSVTTERAPQADRN